MNEIRISANKLYNLKINSINGNHIWMTKQTDLSAEWFIVKSSVIASLYDTNEV